MSDDRAEMQERRQHGLKARNETREARAIRRQTAEEIALTIEAYIPDPCDEGCDDCDLIRDLARLARDIGTQEAPIPPGDAPDPGPAGCTSVHPMASHIPCRKPAGHQGDHESRNGRNWRPREIEKETPS